MAYFKARNKYLETMNNFSFQAFVSFGLTINETKKFNLKL